MNCALTVLKIDVDAHQQCLTIGRLAAQARRAGVTIHWMRQERSRSGRGWHLLVAVSPAIASAMEIVALQAIFGSDPAREANNILRARALPHVPEFWQTRWNVLYDPLA